MTTMLVMVMIEEIRDIKLRQEWCCQLTNIKDDTAAIY